ncbi:MAG: hypothetical protein IJY11_02860 [Clostridia bacterium]|nr:hypothetical protein [Clostridia bacterium]
MKQEFQAEKEISIIEILKALLAKIIYLILALVVGALAGGFYGYYTKVDYKVFGTTLQFYVNPKDSDKVETESIYATYGSYSSNVMKNMVNLLESEMFSATVLDGMIENGTVTGVDKVYVEDTSTGEMTPPDSLTDAQKNWLSTISNAVNFSFNSEGNIAESFIYVTINVDGTNNNQQGITLASLISKQIQISVPDFVKENMPRPSDYEGTNCRLTTLNNEIGQTNQDDAGTSLLTFAIIGGVAGLIVAAVIVIALHMSDKRLRDIDVLSKTFNVPVLGVIPTIDGYNAKSSNGGKGGNA